MKKPIFKNEKEAREFYSDTYPPRESELQEHYIQCCKKYGYIEKSDLEMAKEQFVANQIPGHTSNETLTYIRELKKEIQRLKNES